MKLCIAEKPSVGAELARILGANTRHNGFFEGNGYYVSWTFGHFCTLKTPDDYKDEWKYWQLDTLPMIPNRFGIKLIDNKGVEKQFSVIKELIDKSETIINCGDAGIEGELIQRWVLTKASCNKPVKRLWISSLTDEAIKEGFNNLKDSSDFDLLYAAGSARSIGDWLLGMNATRLYTVKYAKGKGVLSIGRVQTPTLALIVKRYFEITEFVSEKFWEIRTKYKDTYFNITKGRFSDTESAEKIIDSIKNNELEITDFTTKKAKESPLKLFDLTSLQIECNKKYNFSADDTLKHIQSLYEKKLVSYPRVDTTYLPNDLYSKIPNILKGIVPYSKFTEPLLKEKIRKSNKVFDDKKITDHHAIIPTGINPSGLILPEKQVYDTITRRFISAFYPDCIISNTEVKAEVNSIQFKALGKQIIFEGWRELYPKKNDDEQVLPIFVKGEKGPHFPEILERNTQPPKYYTEATLLRAMETAGKQVEDEELKDIMKENGIGRPSTRANIIETLFKRNYIVKQKKNLIPTQTGIDLIKTIKNDLLKSVELTGLWEKKLRLIEKKEYDPKVFLDEMKSMVSELVIEVKKENDKSISIDNIVSNNKTNEITIKNESIELCPKCSKGKIIKGKKSFGCSEFKKGCNYRRAF